MFFDIYIKYNHKIFLHVRPLHLEVIIKNKPSKAKATIFFTSAHSECFVFMHFSPTTLYDIDVILLTP